MTQETYYQVRRPKVVYDSFGSEVVIVNLDSGAYYSLEGTAFWLWQAVLDGRNLSQIVQQGAAEFDAGERELESALAGFLAELETEGIVVATAAAPSSAGGKAAPAPAAGLLGGKQPFSRPVLTRFTDMQDLLLLDPIHDVDASGWPKPAGA